MLLERPRPLLVRRTVSYGNAIFEGGSYTVEGLTSVLIEHPGAAGEVLAAGHLPLLIDEGGGSISALRPAVLIDARMQKQKLDTRPEQARLVIGMGPGFVAGQDCQALIETQRGHSLGRVIWSGAAIPDTGTPGQVGGKSGERVLRAPAGGYVIPAPGVAIGEQVAAGALIAEVAGAAIRAPFEGVLRGLIHPSVEVWAGLKVGDLDPRLETDCYTISDKALALGGAALEAILSYRPLWTGGGGADAPG
jgi:xanthine dehydrogenase accessory factor